LDRRVFTCGKIYDGKTYLANHLAANDYYAEGERVIGYWIGQAAEYLQLEGAVQPGHFEALRKNIRPDTSERLTPRTKETRQATSKEAREAFLRKHKREGSPDEIENFRVSMKPLPNRIAFFDFQCSAQKSVSIMAVVAGDERLREAHEHAARKGFGELEQFACRRKNTLLRADNEMTGNLCAAAFAHDASRALDPQLHTHFVIANATRSATGKWHALNEHWMFKAVRYASKVYQNELAREVKGLGYEIRETRNKKGEIVGFEIAGVPENLCERFAKRREEIEHEIRKFEKEYQREPTTAEIARMARETRSAKLVEISTPAVQARQRSQLLPGEWERLQAIKAEALMKKTGHCRTASAERHSLQASVNHLFERQSVARSDEILAEALNQKLGAIDLDVLKGMLARGEAGVVKLTPENGLLSECATRYGLELECWSVAFVNATKERCSPLNSAFEPSDSLSDEQKAAVRAILSTRDQVFSFRGVAGAGKTTTLKEVHCGLVNRRVFYVAPTASAVKVLQSEGFEKATTLEDFVQNVSRRERLTDAVVICDEAGLKSNRQGAELLHLAQLHRMRVLLVGDARQHVAVEAGDFLRVLETHSQLGRCEVSEIRRQQAAPAYKAAMMRMAAGDAKGGLKDLDALGWVQSGGADYLTRAAEDYLWLTDNGRDPGRCLLITPTWEENYRLTDAIRYQLKAQGTLDDCAQVIVHETCGWTDQQKRNPRNYVPGQFVTITRASDSWRAGDSIEVCRVERNAIYGIAPDRGEVRLPLGCAESFDVAVAKSLELGAGDRILIRANDKKNGLINGQVLTVARIDSDQSILTRDGVRIPPSFKRLCHGYAITSYKAQGRTSEHVVVAAESLSAKSAYVACSRGKVSCTLHTPDKQRLLDRLPEGNRRAALDAIGENFSQVPTTVLNRAELWARHLGQTDAYTVTIAQEFLRRRLEQTGKIIQGLKLSARTQHRGRTFTPRVRRGV
jgi:conjugative relaxase-like TrwC/TraI family protein